MPFAVPAEPFHAPAAPQPDDGQRVGVLLVHGFTGAPSSMLPWARHLAEQGFGVSVPRLPGHGTTWQELNRTRWTDWYGEVDRAFDALRARTDQVIASDIKAEGVQEDGYDRTPLRAAHSMTTAWRTLREDLPRVTQPLLVFRSAVDHVVDPSSAALIRATASSRDLTERVLENSYHVATLDHDAPTIFEESAEFARRVTGP